MKKKNVKTNDIKFEKLAQLVEDFKKEFGDLYSKYQALLDASTTKTRDLFILNNFYNEFDDLAQDEKWEDIFSDASAAVEPMPEAVQCQFVDKLFKIKNLDVLEELDIWESPWFTGYIDEKDFPTEEDPRFVEKIEDCGGACSQKDAIPEGKGDFTNNATSLNYPDAEFIKIKSDMLRFFAENKIGKYTWFANAELIEDVDVDSIQDMLDEEFSIPRMVYAYLKSNNNYIKNNCNEDEWYRLFMDLMEDLYLGGYISEATTMEVPNDWDSLDADTQNLYRKADPTTWLIYNSAWNDYTKSNAGTLREGITRRTLKKDSKPNTPKKYVIKFKDGMKIECLDSEGKTKEVIIAEAKKVHKEFKDNKTFDEELEEVAAEVIVPQENAIVETQETPNQEMFEGTDTTNTLGIKVGEDDLIYIPTGAIVCRNFRRYIDSGEIQYQRAVGIGSNVCRVAQKSMTNLNDVEWVSTIVQDILGTFDIIMVFANAREEQDVTRASLEAERRRSIGRENVNLIGQDSKKVKGKDGLGIWLMVMQMEELNLLKEFKGQTINPENIDQKILEFNDLYRKDDEHTKYIQMDRAQMYHYLDILLKEGFIEGNSKTLTYTIPMDAYKKFADSIGFKNVDEVNDTQENVEIQDATMEAVLKSLFYKELKRGNKEFGSALKKVKQQLANEKKPWSEEYDKEELRGIFEEARSELENRNEVKKNRK